MPSSDWRSNLALGGWIIAGVLAALLYSEWVADGFSFGGRKRKQETEYSASEKSVSKSNHPPPSTFKREPPPQEYKPDCTKPENGDLCAQRRMAAAAEEQTRLNIFGLILLLGTLWFTGRAAMHARDAAKATRDSAIAAELSAAAADKTTKATIEAAEASKRSADAAEQALRGLERP